MSGKALLSYLFLTLITFFVGFIFVSAQVRDTDIVLTISPQYPNPNQAVTATISSYSTNLDKALISWSTDNQEITGGMGKKVFYFTMGDIGSSLNLTATINTVDGQSLKKTIIITPTNVDILWEASDAYTPPFYKGKALAPSQGEFKVVAMPNLINKNGKINANNLSYTWKQDGDTQPDSSGWGKSSYIFNNSYLDKVNKIEVKVSDIAGATTASGSATLYTSKPEIVFYKNDPLLGINWENALSNGFKVGENGETLVVAPYFFSPQDINSPDLSFDWLINGNKIETPSPKNILSIKPEVGQTGNANIKVIINNINTLFQTMEKQINVEF